MKSSLLIIVVTILMANSIYIVIINQDNQETQVYWDEANPVTFYESGDKFLGERFQYFPANDPVDPNGILITPIELEIVDIETTIIKLRMTTGGSSSEFGHGMWTYGSHFIYADWEYWAQKLGSVFTEDECEVTYETSEVRYDYTLRSGNLTSVRVATNTEISYWKTGALRYKQVQTFVSYPNWTTFESRDGWWLNSSAPINQDNFDKNVACSSPDPSWNEQITQNKAFKTTRDVLFIACNIGIALMLIDKKYRESIASD